jgi:hypothetical protein
MIKPIAVSLIYLLFALGQYVPMPFNPSAVTFTHIQGGSDFVTGLPGTACHPSLSANPALGNVVIVGIVSNAQTSGGSRPSALAVADANSNSYSATTSTPDVLTISTLPVNLYVFYFVVTGTPSKTINVTWTTSTTVVCWADEFHKSTGTISFDKDAAGAGAVCSGTSAATPSITPSGSPGMLYAAGVDPDNALTAPGAAGTLGSWTGTVGGPEEGATGGNTEYDLSASSATAVNFTCGASGDTYGAMAAAFD